MEDQFSSQKHLDTFTTAYIMVRQFEEAEVGLIVAVIEKNVYLSESFAV